MNKVRKNIIAAILVLIMSLGVLAPTMIIASSPASAAVYVGDSELQGYEPTDIVSTDTQMTLDDAPQATDKIEQTITKVVKILMPILMIACVCIIIYNAIKNIFVPKEQRVKMGDVIKNMFIQFFFILFAWVIVELIVFAITGGETILFSTIFS